MKINVLLFIVIFFSLIRDATAQEFYHYNIEKKIKDLKQNTPSNCLSHGEIDCSQGPDLDGSVICKDGFKKAVMSYSSECLEARLEAQYLVATNGTAVPFVKHSKKLIEDLKGQTPIALHLNLRNLSDVKVKNIRVEFTLERKYPYYASGPSEIEPYGLAEYSLELSNIERDVTLQQLLKTIYRVDCSNCSAILTGR